MSKVAIQGNASGTGTLTIAAQNTSSNYTLTIPNETGTLVTSATTSGINGSAISSGTVAEAYGGTGTNTGYYGFKNRIINGGMAVDQRNAGAAQTITAAAALAYTVDRWYAWTTGANGTTQRVAGTAPSQYALKFTGATSNTLCGIGQRIEQLNSYDLASTAVTISAYMTASTNTTITAILNGPSTTADTFGTIASPTVTQIATTTFSVTTTRTLFTWTISAATMSGFNKGLELIFKAASGLGNGVTWTIESVQLEAGSAATSFDYRPYGTELALCQRYLPYFTGSTSSSPISMAEINTSTFARAYVPFLVQARVAPTGITVSAVGDFRIDSAGSSFTATGVDFASVASPTCAQVNVTISGATAGRAALFNFATSGKYIYFTGCEL